VRFELLWAQVPLLENFPSMDFYNKLPVWVQQASYKKLHPLIFIGMG